MTLLVLLATSLIGFGVVDAASANSRSPRGPKPTIVLVHGAWADGSSWSPVAKRLQRGGYTVDVPPNPLRGLDADADYLRSYLATVPGPIVLVGHSYGGAVITNAATGNPNVKELVYIDAFAPDVGESLLDLIAQQPGSAFAADPSTVFSAVPYPGAANGDVDLYIKPSIFHDAFAADLSDTKAAVLAAEQRPLTFSAAKAPSGVPAWKTIPSWYVVGTADKVLPAAEQLFMAERAHAHIDQVNASHVSMLSHPDAVEDLIVQAAHAAG
jgi:pimeloyl-ACP methyl ester carboxylesterase